MGIVKNVLKKRTENRARLEKEAPDLYNGFNELMKHFYKHGVLERKYKELMAVSASVTTHCVPCLSNHANNAMATGATREKVLEAAGLKG
jgi:AhpD family alkylhydroperoxidase